MTGTEALERRIDELCEENERLKSEFNKMDVWHSRELKAAMAENAKLRELAVLNWEWAHSCCGNNCKMQTDGCGYQIDRECNYEREIYDRMRELGIEVDG